MKLSLFAVYRRSRGRTYALFTFFIVAMCLKSLLRDVINGSFREVADDRVNSPGKSEEPLQGDSGHGRYSSRNIDWEAKGFKLASHKPLELEMQPCSDRGMLCPTRGLSPEGILYTAYSLDISQLATKLIPEVLTSATSFRRHHNSTTLLTCLVTNVPTKFIDGTAIDYVIQVRDDLLFAGSHRPGAVNIIHSGLRG
jgi:hypothetical protein